MAFPRRNSVSQKKTYWCHASEATRGTTQKCAAEPTQNTHGHFWILVAEWEHHQSVWCRPDPVWTFQRLSGDPDPQTACLESKSTVSGQKETEIPVQRLMPNTEESTPIGSRIESSLDNSPTNVILKPQTGKPAKGRPKLRGKYSKQARKPKDPAKTEFTRKMKIQEKLRKILDDKAQALVKAVFFSFEMMFF